VREQVGAGTKSQRDAFLLVTPDGRRLQLRLKDGNPLYDPAFEAFLGHEVVGHGRVVGVSAVLDSLPRRTSAPGS